MFHNRKAILKFLYIYAKYQSYINSKYLHHSIILCLRKPAMTKKTVDSILISPKEAVAGTATVPNKSTNINLNFYGIEGDEGVTYIKESSKSNNLILNSTENSEKPKSEFKYVSFGAVRLDSENKPTHYVQFNDLLSSKAENVTKHSKTNIKNDKSNDVQQFNMKIETENNFEKPNINSNVVHSKCDKNIGDQKTEQNVKKLNTTFIHDSNNEIEEFDKTSVIFNNTEKQLPEKKKFDDPKTEDSLEIKEATESFIDRLYFLKDCENTKKEFNNQNQIFDVNNIVNHMPHEIELDDFKIEDVKENKQSENYIDNMYFPSSIDSSETNTENTNFNEQFLSNLQLISDRNIENDKEMKNNLFPNNMKKVYNDQSQSPAIVSEKDTNFIQNIKVPKDADSSYIDQHYFEEEMPKTRFSDNNEGYNNFIEQQYFDRIENKNISKDNSSGEECNANFYNKSINLENYENSSINQTLLSKSSVIKKENSFMNFKQFQVSAKIKNKFLFSSNSSTIINDQKTSSVESKEDLQNFNRSQNFNDNKYSENLRKREALDVLQSTDLRAEDDSESAYDFVKNLRQKEEMSDLIKKGISAKKEKKLDSKGFRILKHQVPSLQYFTRDEMLDLLQENILYSDDDIVVLNKPYNLIIHESKTTKDNACLSMYLKDLAKILDPNAKSPELFTVHRLDKETTGCLLLARNELSAEKMKALFAQRKVIKTYWIVTSNIPDPLEGIIDIPISEGRIGNKTRMVLHPDLPEDVPYVNHSKCGKRAITSYSVIATSGNAALVEVKPDTGIKHQIRVHFGFGLACPILGDHKYSHLDKLAPQKLPSDLLQRLHVRQSKVRHIPLHIHSKHALIPQYSDGRNLFITAPLPKHMVENLRTLKFKKK